MKSPATAGLGGPAVDAAAPSTLSWSPSPETILRYKSDCLERRRRRQRVSERHRSETLPPLAGGRVPHLNSSELPETRQSTARLGEGESARPRPTGGSVADRRAAPTRADRLDPPEAGACPRPGSRAAAPTAGRGLDRRCGAVRTSLVDGKNISRASETSVSDVSGRSQRCSSPETRETSEVHHV